MVRHLRKWPIRLGSPKSRVPAKPAPLPYRKLEVEYEALSLKTLVAIRTDLAMAAHRAVRGQQYQLAGALNAAINDIDRFFMRRQ
jgi:hypothetical protein